MRIIHCKTNVLKQKVSGKDLNGFIDKICTLVTNQTKGATEPNQNEFINELSCDCFCIGF